MILFSGRFSLRKKTDILTPKYVFFKADRFVYCIVWENGERNLPSHYYYNMAHW